MKLSSANKYKLSCLLSGGLGNQLFQIFATISQSCNSNRKFIFAYESRTTGMTYRRTYWDDFLIGLRPFTTIQASNGTSNEDIYRRFAKLQHTQHHYEPLTLPDVDVCLIGYFQSYKYFDNYKNVIFSMMKLTQQKLNLLESIRDTNIEIAYRSNIENRGVSGLKGKFSIKHYDTDNDSDNDHTDIYTISMHFRVGDYVTVSDCHPVLDASYYKNSLEKVICLLEENNTNFNQLKVFVFYETVDKRHVDKIINELQDMHPYIEFIRDIQYHLKEDWQQMLLMSCCHSNIIANSTFSWWGAYLNEDVDYVIYPSKWFGPKLAHHQMQTMFLNKWICVDA
jgi:hypothetical protein